jgi:hypothetical protein
MQVQKLLHQGQCAVMWRGTCNCQTVFLDRLSAVGPAQVEWTIDEGNPPDDLLAHALRLKGIDVRMLNNSSVSMYSDVHTSISYCMHARSHDKCAMRRCADDARSCQLANRCQANCSHQYDRASSPQYAIPAVATSLVLTAGMCKPSLALGGHRCATGCRSLPSVAPCPVRPVQRRCSEALCLPDQALAP